MTADAPGATADYSNRSVAATGARRAPAGTLPGPSRLRTVLSAVGLLGALLLVVSTFTTVVQIKVLTTTEVDGKDLTVSGFDLHSVALIVIALFAMAMLLGAVRGARPAMAALATAGLLALGLIVGLDVPELDNTGEISRFYEDVSAGAATGFYLETLGAVLLLASGGLMLILSADRVARRLTGLADRVEGAAATGVAATRRRSRGATATGPASTRQDSPRRAD